MLSLPALLALKTYGRLKRVDEYKFVVQVVLMFHCRLCATSSGDIKFILKSNFNILMVHRMDLVTVDIRIFFGL